MARKREKKFLNVKEQPHGQSAKHPFVNADNHEALLKYCTSRLDFAKNNQSGLKERFNRIDTKLASFAKPTPEEFKMEQANLRGEKVKPINANTPFALAQLGRGVTFLASVFCPDTGMFEALTLKDKQPIANAFAEELNKQALKGGYFREFCKTFLDGLKYNLCSMHIDWEERKGTVFDDPSGSGVPKMVEKTIYAGNSIKHNDMYNVLWDPSVNPCDVYKDGEYAAIVKLHTPFKIKQMIQNGEIFNCRDMGAGRNNPMAGDYSYYTAVPSLRYNDHSPDRLPDGTINWASVLSYGHVDGYDSDMYEEVNMYIRLIPQEFGLTEARPRKLEIWRITILNGQRIVATEQINNMHNYLPVVFASPNEDGLGLQVKSAGETLQPFQDVANFMLNAFVESIRSNVWDLTIYDPTMIAFNSVGNDVAARIPVLPAYYGKDITKGIWNRNKTLEVDKFLNQMSSMLELMEWIFPTRLLQQVADIDRAVKDQVATVVQAAQREVWKLAKMYDDQMFVPTRFIMFTNTMQYSETIEIIGEDGTIQEVSPKQFRQMKLEYFIGAGLKALDRMQEVLIAKDIFNTVLSSGNAASEFNIPDFTNHISSIQGMKSDLRQFRKTPEQKQQELQMQAQAQAQAQAAKNGQAGGAQ